MAQTITILQNAVHAKLHEPSREAKLEVQRILSYAVAGAEHTDAFKKHVWDGRSSFLDFRSGSFPAGFVHYLSARLRRAGHEVRVVRKPLPAPLGPENPKIDSFPDDPRYDYQPEVVRRLIKHGQIIAQVATGGGKSRIARLAFARIRRPTLFLTTRSILMFQMQDTFEKDLGVRCSVLGQGQFGHVNAEGQTSIKMMSVGMVQTLMARLADPDPKDPYDKQVAQAQLKAQTIKLLGMFEFVILEEAHEASGNSYFEILRHCKNAHYRLALTATPFMKDDEEANMRLMAVSGPIAIKVTEKMLIDRGILATPKFKLVQLKDRPVKLLRGTSWDAAYRLGVVTNPERNRAIVREVVRAAGYGLSSMVLVQHTRHGDVLQLMLEEAGLRVEFLQGADNKNARKAALARLGAGQIDVLIGTTILDVGVDVPAVGLVVLAGGGKAEVALRQRIGRGLRAKKKGPNIALVVDFDDPWNMHTKSHALQRFSIIMETEGFAENVVREDFDFAGYGFVRKSALTAELV